MGPFRHYTNKELQSLYNATKLSSNPILLNNYENLIKLSTTLLGNNITSRIVGNLIGKIFSAGETINDLNHTIKRLSLLKQGTIIDYCTEGETSEYMMNKTLKEIKTAVKLASRYSNSSIAVKPSSLISTNILRFMNSLQINHSKPNNVWKESLFYDTSTENLRNRGLDDTKITSLQNGIERLREICILSNQYGIKVMIDAEQTYFQTAINALVARLQQEFNHTEGIVYCTFQSYLTINSQVLESYIEWANRNKIKTAVKLVRGAYMVEELKLSIDEKYKYPIFGTKFKTDSAYDQDLLLLFESYKEGNSICIASHNEQSIQLGKELIKQNRIHRLLGGITFGQLLGMKERVSYNLTNQSYMVQKYVPFGPYNKLIPYLLRRSQEQKDMISEFEAQIDEIAYEYYRRTNN